MTRSSRQSTLISFASTMAGVLLAFAVLGVRSADRELFLSQREAFLELPDDVQRAIRLSDTDFRAQSLERQTELRQMVQAVNEDPALKAVMQKFSSWWASLSQAEWDEFQTLKDEEQVAFAVTGLREQPRSKLPIRIEFPGQRNNRLPVLMLSYDEFSKIVSDIAAELPPSEVVQRDLTELSTEQFRTLRLVLWVFESTREQRDPQLLETRNQTFRSALLTHCADEQWKAAFNQTLSTISDRNFRRAWLLMTQLSILGQATTTLGDELQQKYPVSDEQILDAFMALDDKQLQQSLMTASAADVRIRMASLARLNRDGSAEERLLMRFLRFAEERERMFRFLTFGFGGPGGGPGSGPPGGFGPDRDGQRRDERPNPGDGRRGRDER